ncbi:MAG: rhomboid family intramembrane serine protease [Halobacteriaceae archaeon]
MARCDRCGEDVSMPYQCRLCGGTFCSGHRLPENHDCPGLDNWGDPSGVFDSGFDDSVRDSGERSAVDRVAARLPVDTGRGGFFGYFRGNMTFVFLGLMWVTYALQYLVAPLFGLHPGVPGSGWYQVFTLNTEHPAYVWTWVTSVFAHGGLTHIFMNSIVLYFFGPPVEKRMGSRAFFAFFLLTGAIAGLAQVGASLIVAGATTVPIGAPGGSAVLGASGAIAAVMGVLTVLNPNLRIYIYFIIPMPLWLATLLFAGFAVLSSTVGGVGAGNVAQVAHLAGLLVGLGYGLKLKREGERAPPQLQLGGRRGGGRGGPGGRRRF